MEGNDFVIQVKGNAKRVLKGCKDIVTSQTLHSSLKTYHQSDNGHGRRENRRIRVIDNLPKNLFPADWIGIKSVIELKCWGYRENKEYEVYHYYISSMENKSAKFYSRGIRAHWGIENKVHWVKDVILGEDSSRIRGHNLSSVMSVIRTTILNIYRTNNITSITKGIEKYTNRIPECLKLIDNVYI